jgi:predicted phosphodiesterase
MTTLVVSDLHLGGRTRAEVLQDPERRAALVAALDGVERLVLLGDVLELRHGPVREALERARPVLEDLGRHVPEVVLVAGNHDHALVAGWLERIARSGPPELGLEQRIAPADASYAAGRLAEWLGPRTSVAYPGLWLRDDVYATHGHYLDLHCTVPSFERLGAGMTTRIVGDLPARATPGDYEARLAPVYAWIDAIAEWAPDGRAAGGAGSAQRAYRALTGGRGGVRARLLAGAFPLAIAGVNRAGLGPVRADLSGQSIRTASLRAMHEVCGRLGLGAAHVIFGHSHRTGPLPGDDPLEWGRLVNCGSWVLETHYMQDPAPHNPYWPGGAVRVDAGGPPRLQRLLG